MRGWGGVRWGFLEEDWDEKRILWKFGILIMAA